MSKLKLTPELRRELVTYRRACRVHGPLVPIKVGTALLDRDHATLFSMITTGKLRQWQFFGHPWLSLREVEELALMFPDLDSP